VELTLLWIACAGVDPDKIKQVLSIFSQLPCCLKEGGN